MKPCCYKKIFSLIVKVLRKYKFFCESTNVASTIKLSITDDLVIYRAKKNATQQNTSLFLYGMKKKLRNYLVDFSFRNM